MTGISIQAIRDWTPGYLGESMDYGRMSGRLIEDNYRVTQHEIDTANWKGVAYESASGKAQLDYTAAQDVHAATEAHATDVSRMASQLSTSRQTALIPVDAAGKAKFTVTDAGGVYDPNPPSNPEARAARQAEAEGYRDAIATAAGSFYTQEAQVAASIAGHTANLTGTGLHAAMTDFKTGPGALGGDPMDPEPAPPGIGDDPGDIYPGTTVMRTSPLEAANDERLGPALPAMPKPAPPAVTTPPCTVGQYATKSTETAAGTALLTAGALLMPPPYDIMFLTAALGEGFMLERTAGNAGQMIDCVTRGFGG